MSLNSDRAYREAIEQKRALREQGEADRLEAVRRSIRRDPTQPAKQIAATFHMAEERVRKLRREMGLAPGGSR